MESIYHVNPELDIPIYQQLVDSIRAAVKTGVLAPGQQLPTVQQLSDTLNIARGTIKRAYDELERGGFVEKAQGRGTFVRYQPQSSESRKERAMAAIDALLDQLQAMGLSASEVNIFLNLKLRQRSEQEQQVKIAVVECNPENLTQMAQQLRQIPRAELYPHLLENLAQYPYQLGEDMDLILTTAAHAQELARLLPVSRRVTPVALRLNPKSMGRIIKLRKGHRIGILCRSQRFGALLHNTCLQFAEEAHVEEPELLSERPDLGAFLKGKQAVLVPADYESYCAQQQLRQLQEYKGKLISCGYELDEGSLLYLQEKSKRILEAKSI